jgi:hypothetical protein
MADINLEVLSTRAGFNSAVRHIKKITGILDSLGTGQNLADILNDPAVRESGGRTAVILKMILVDKFGYKTASRNLSAVAGELEPLAACFAKWNAVDLVAAYHHPDRGLLVANPKIAGDLVNFGVLRKRELLVIYAGKADAPADTQCLEAARLAGSLFEGGKPVIPAAFYSGGFTAKKAAPAAEEPARTPPATTAASPVISRGPVRMTPLYSVAVRNELFHNGNVEAWKRIIASYNAKYPELKVYIYYEGERILDINALFKWGKVKHGRSIQFAVAGNEIKDVAKLQRYFAQGASNQFDAFLRGPVNSTLNLF